MKAVGDYLALSQLNAEYRCFISVRWEVSVSVFHWRVASILFILLLLLSFLSK